MKAIMLTFLFLLAMAANAADESPTPPAAAPPTAPAEAGKAPAGTPALTLEQEQLQQAFDGAMTCSALTAVKSNAAPESEAWRWGNRSFAFGMLAVRFYTDATKRQLENEEVNNMLTEYANRLGAMTPEQRQPFEEGCARKYPDIDKLCEINKCPRTAPGTPPAAAPGP